MEQVKILYKLLEETAEIIEDAINVEYEKYNAAVKNDIKLLDEIISKEQVFYLKMKVLEQKRDKLMREINLRDRSLKEMIHLTDNEDSTILKKIYDRLNKALKDFKKINNECRVLIEIRLNKINAAMNELGHNENQNNYKDLIVSKKI